MTSRLLWRLPLLLAGLGALLLVAGCAGQPTGLDPKQAAQLKVDLTAFQPLASAQVDAQVKTWQKQLDALQRTKGDATEQARLQYLLAYALEKQELYQGALEAYAKVPAPYQPLGQFRRAVIYQLVIHSKKEVGNAYSAASNAKPGTTAYFPVTGTAPAVQQALASDAQARIEAVDLVPTAQAGMDAAYRGTPMYDAVDRLVKLLGANPKYSYGLALIVLALAVKIITTPFTVMAFKNIRAMQRLAPLQKELQAKYGDDQATLAREQMRLYKKHKVSPMGGCLPMLIQMPVLILVYQAIRAYIYQFSHASFLWVPSLALPDWPLLILYAASMFLSQKLTAMPSPDAQQQQMQNTMAYMMPIMFTVLFASMPSAFILYWFTYNVLITGHQWWLNRQPLPSLEEDETQAGAEAGPAPVRPQRIRRRR